MVSQFNAVVESSTSSSNYVANFMVTTVPGLEDIALEEAHEKFNVLDYALRFGDVGGRV